MIKIELNEHTADDVKCIEELQAMGFSDDYIQSLYDISMRSRRVKENERKTD